jgi:hypothetical protein
LRQPGGKLQQCAERIPEHDIGIDVCHLDGDCHIDQPDAATGGSAPAVLVGHRRTGG